MLLPRTTFLAVRDRPCEAAVSPLALQENPRGAAPSLPAHQPMVAPIVLVSRSCPPLVWVRGWVLATFPSDLAPRGPYLWKKPPPTTCETVSFSCGGGTSPTLQLPVPALQRPSLALRLASLARRLSVPARQVPAAMASPARLSDFYRRTSGHADRMDMAIHQHSYLNFFKIF